MKITNWWSQLRNITLIFLNQFSKPFFPLLLCTLALVAYKFYLLEINSRAAFNCQWCLVSGAVIHEIQFLIIIFTLHLTSFTRYTPISILFRILVVLMLLVFAIDVVLLKQFLVRFTLHELIKFIAEYGAILGFIQQILKNNWQIVIAATSCLIVVFVIYRYFKLIKNRNIISPIFIFSLYVTGFSLESFKTVDFHTLYLQNSIEAFFTPQLRNRPYSEQFITSFPAENDNNKLCFNGIGARPNVILVIVESLSMYHSKSFSGLHNWTPQLDLLSEHGEKFKRFYANGVSTEDGLIALLTGLPPIPKGMKNTKTIFQQFNNIEQTVPRMLNKLGYRTLFLTTGNLNFLQKGKWLDNIGFQYIEGHDAVFYKGMKRFHFNAAPDAALYARAIQKLQENKDIESSPLFMTLETVSTHHPHIDPESGVNSEEKVFRYADQELGEFINNLHKQEFFHDGYVIIVSDHRAMLPMRHDEFSLYGDAAYARVPFAVLGNKMTGEVMNAFSQTDLLPSLRYWLSEDNHCINQNQGIFLPVNIHQPKCIYTRRSYNPDRIYLQCSNAEYTIQLDGDDSHYVDEQEGSAELLNQLHRLRLGKGF